MSVPATAKMSKRPKGLGKKCARRASQSDSSRRGVRGRISDWRSGVASFGVRYYSKVAASLYVGNKTRLGVDIFLIRINALLASWY